MRSLAARSTSLAVLASAILGVGLVAAEAIADDAEPDGGIPTSDLTRAEVMRAAAAENLEVLSDQLSLEGSEMDSRAARRPYLPVLSFDAGYANTGSDHDHGVSYSAGVGWSSPVGTEIGLSIGAGHAIDEGSSGTAVSITASQDLLKGAGRAGSGEPLDRADLEARRQREVFRQSLGAFLLEVDRSYWNLAYCQADLEIKRRSRDRAKAQFEDTRENIDRGILAPTEIYVVEENLVSFEKQLLEAERSLALARSRLALLMNRDPESEPEAADDLEISGIRLPDREEAVAVALERSPRLSAQRIALEQADVAMAHEENQILPALGLDASLGLSGASDAYGDAWTDVLTAKDPDFGVGLSFEMPLGTSANDAKAERARIDKRRCATDRDLMEMEIAFRVRDLLTQLASQRARVDLARRVVELAELKLAAEEEKYRSGISKLAEVVRFQRELDSALISYRRAQLEMLLDHAALLDAQGVLPESVGIEIR